MAEVPLSCATALVPGSATDCGGDGAVCDVIPGSGTSTAPSNSAAADTTDGLASDQRRAGMLFEGGAVAVASDARGAAATVTSNGGGSPAEPSNRRCLLVGSSRGNVVGAASTAGLRLVVSREAVGAIEERRSGTEAVAALLLSVVSGWDREGVSPGSWKKLPTSTPPLPVDFPRSTPVMRRSSARSFASLLVMLAKILLIAGAAAVEGSVDILTAHKN